MKTLNYYLVEVGYVDLSGNRFKRRYAFKHQSSATSFSHNLFSHYSTCVKGSPTIEVDGRPCQVSSSSVVLHSVKFLDSLL